MNLCKQCNTETTNPKFCSRSCAVKFNNRVKPKRKKQQKYCIICHIPISYRSKYCDKHNCRKIDWSQRTLADAIYKNDANRYGKVREHARRLYKNSNRPQHCISCGYDKHFEVCHIKAISSFPLDTIISVVNNLNNLEALCPNCHWEKEHL